MAKRKATTRAAASAAKKKKKKGETDETPTTTAEEVEGEPPEELATVEDPSAADDTEQALPAPSGETTASETMASDEPVSEVRVEVEDPKEEEEKNGKAEEKVNETKQEETTAGESSTAEPADESALGFRVDREGAEKDEIDPTPQAEDPPAVETVPLSEPAPAPTQVTHATELVVPATSLGSLPPTPIQASAPAPQPYFQQADQTYGQQISGLPHSYYGAAAITAQPGAVDPSFSATLTSPAQIVEEREEVPPIYIGKVIGKGGEMIRDLQARSGARLDVDQNVPVGQPRVLTYRGTRATVDFAKMLVRMLSQEGVSEMDLPLGEAIKELLIIPSQSVGKVIGRGGEMIRELQNRSSARIQVDHSGMSGTTPDKKQVTIIGTEASVAKAKEMIMFLVSNPLMEASQSINMLTEDKLKTGNPWGSGPPYVNLPNQGYNMTPDMLGGGGGGYQHQMGAYSAPPAVGGYSPYPPQEQQAYQAPVQQLGYYGGAGGQYGVAAGQVEVDVMRAPKQYMGRVIGQRGVTVNDLQRRSGCDIQINQNVPYGQDCEITIRGTRQGIESVKHMIREIIEAGPAHPYAGGADQGHGGGHQNYYQQQQQGGFGQASYGNAYAQQPQYAPPYAAIPPPAPPVASAWKSATTAQGQGKLGSMMSCGVVDDSSKANPGLLQCTITMSKLERLSGRSRLE